MEVELFASSATRASLESESFKAVCIGSDFGYGNFGDILQHFGAVDSLRDSLPGVHVVSVAAISSIGRGFELETAERDHPSDMTVYVADSRISPADLQALGLAPVFTIRNVGWIYLYGGGFLNLLWGDFVVGVADFFNRAFPEAVYCVSGQQVAKDYSERLKGHIDRTRPALFGVRDAASEKVLERIGVGHRFSGDDAVEQLASLRQRLLIQSGEGALLHLNISDYTGNESNWTELVRHLDSFKYRTGSPSEVTVVQAFLDAREDVSDSIETIKRLESRFPFSDYQVCSLVPIVRDPVITGHLVGALGYSSSYHVAMMLLHAGIPCWLRGNNAYYAQKRESLGIRQTFEDFLRSPVIPDFSRYLEQREAWLDELKERFRSHSPVPRVWHVDGRKSSGHSNPFRFKGEPNYRERLLKVEAENRDASTELERTRINLSGARESAKQVVQLTNSIAVLESRMLDHFGVLNTGLADRLGILTQGLKDNFGEVKEYLASIAQAEKIVAESDALKQRIERELAHSAGMAERIHYLNSRITDLGQQVHAYRTSSQELASDLERTNNRLDRELDLKSGLEDDVKAAQRREDELRQRVTAYDDLLTDVGICYRELSSVHEYALGDLRRMCCRIEELNDQEHVLRQQIEAYERLMTTTGDSYRRLARDYDYAASQLAETMIREAAANSHVQRMVTSKSWRWTRMPRTAIRFIRTRRFDENGEVGLFEAAKRLAIWLGIPPRMRSRIGARTIRFRRR